MLYRVKEGKMGLSGHVRGYTGRNFVYSLIQDAGKAAKSLEFENVDRGWGFETLRLKVWR